MTAAGRLGASPGRPAGCVVWLTGVGSVPAAPGLMDAGERARLASMPDQERARFATGVALIRTVIGGYTGTDPEAVRVERACPDCPARHGKPEVPGTGLHISLAHSGRLVALAVTRRAPVGVDIEMIRPRDIDGLWRMILAPGECRSAAAGFYTSWVRKESVVKATGDGLRTPLTRVEVTGPAEAPALRRYRGRAPAAVMRDFRPAAGYAGAVTVLADGPLDLALRWWPPRARHSRPTRTPACR